MWGIFKNNNDLEFHITYEHTEVTQWNCMSCSYQSNNKDSLKNYMNFKHTKESEKYVYNCEACARQFRTTWHLRNHTRDEHGRDEECFFFISNKIDVNLIQFAGKNILMLQVP